MDRRVRDLAMIQDPDQWPYWPKLPLVREWTANPSVGILLNWMTPTNVNELWWYPGQNIITFDPQAEHTVLDLTGIENLLSSGWRVD